MNCIDITLAHILFTQDLLHEAVSYSAHVLSNEDESDQCTVRDVQRAPETPGGF
jgi:hypothetical protein